MLPVGWQSYAEALKKVSNIHTGTQLMKADYDSMIEPALKYAPIGHKKALRLVTQAHIVVGGNNNHNKH